MRIFRRLLQGVGLLLLVVIAAAAIYVWRSFPSLDGELCLSSRGLPSGKVHRRAQRCAEAHG